MTKSHLRTRLILDLQEVPSDEMLATLLTAGDVACALLPKGERLDLEGTVRSLQEAGVAALARDDVDLAVSLRADGVHLSAAPDIAEVFQTTRACLSGNEIVGCEIGTDRHVAMVLAEAGADYVAFAFPEQTDDIQWWSEIFEVPCVAMGSLTPDDAATLARAGVEFVSTPANETVIRDLDASVAPIALVEA